jgi:soluble lytic murein transglycosylase-like protein
LHSVMRRREFRIGVILILLFFPGAAWGEIFGYQDKNGYWVFPEKGTASQPGRSPEESLLFIQKFEPVISEASVKYGLDPHLIKAVIRAESDFDHRAVSPKGALGLMQLMPATAEELNVGNPFDPEENILGGARYLSDLLKRFGQDQNLALAAYNAGPGRVESSGGVPRIAETENYVKKVMAYYKEYKSSSL